MWSCMRAGIAKLFNDRDAELAGKIAGIYGVLIARQCAGLDLGAGSHSTITRS